MLEQRLATQAAEQQALELKSQVYASIGIMAGSYAHNIKNLLVRPNDLLSRCLEADGLSHDQERMLRRSGRRSAPSPSACSKSCRRSAAIPADRSWRGWT